VRRLAHLGFTNVHCLTRDDAKQAALCQGIDAGGLTFLRGDIAATDVLTEGVRDAAIVLNAAGYARAWGTREAFWEVNADAPKALVELLHSDCQYIHISSASVYGFAAQDITADSPIVVSDPLYTASKGDIHAWLRRRMAQPAGGPITVIAPVIVWGPGDHVYIPGIRSRLAQGTMMNFAGAKPLAFVHIDDLVDLILLCLHNPKAYGRQLIADGPDRFTMQSYADKIAEYAGFPPATRNVPIWLAMPLATVAETTTRWANRRNPEKEPDLTRLQVLLFTKPLPGIAPGAESDLGYAPSRTFENAIEGIRDYVQSLA